MSNETYCVQVLTHQWSYIIYQVSILLQMYLYLACIWDASQAETLACHFSAWALSIDQDESKLLNTIALASNIFLVVKLKTLFGGFFHFNIWFMKCCRFATRLWRKNKLMPCGFSEGIYSIPGTFNVHRWSYRVKKSQNETLYASEFICNGTIYQYSQFVFVSEITLLILFE